MNNSGIKINQETKLTEKNIFMTFSILNKHFIHSSCVINKLQIEIKYVVYEVQKCFFIKIER